MIISSPGDYREAARRKLPPFLFEYIDGGAYAETTLARNVADWREVARIVLHRDPAAEAGRSRRCWQSHMDRARWMTKTGYRKILEQAVAEARSLRH